MANSNPMSDHILWFRQLQTPSKELTKEEEDFLEKVEESLVYGEISEEEEETLLNLYKEKTD